MSKEKWKVESGYSDKVSTIIEGDTSVVGYVYSGVTTSATQRATRIVRAVNCVEDFRGAIESAILFIEANGDDGIVLSGLRAALAKCKEGE